MSDRPVCLYDANVLYSAQLRDFLMRLALGEVVQAHWTKRIHEEWMRNAWADYPRHYEGGPPAHPGLNGQGTPWSFGHGI
jgi:hypothetical protein